MPVNIVFDFGAVLFTWRPDLIVRSLFSDEAPTPMAARQLAADIFRHPDWEAFDAGTLELPSVVARTATRLNLPHPVLHAMMSAVPEHLAPMPETVRLLERLHLQGQSRGNIKLYFLSNMPAPFARLLQQRHAFLKVFEGGVFSGDVQLIKPQPEIFQLLQTRYALDPRKTVFIDDMAANVQAARDHGWSGIHFESAAKLHSSSRHIPHKRPALRHLLARRICPPYGGVRR